MSELEKALDVHLQELPTRQLRLTPNLGRSTTLIAAEGWRKSKPVRLLNERQAEKAGTGLIAHIPETITPEVHQELVVLVTVCGLEGVDRQIVAPVGIGIGNRKIEQTV